MDLLELNQTTNFTFTVRRVGNLSQTVSVNYTLQGTGPNSASWKDEYFIAGKTGSITFDPTESIKTISIPISIGDEVADREFTLVLDGNNPNLLVDRATRRFRWNYQVQSSLIISNLAPSLWLDAADITTFTLVGNEVSEWRDKSGFNRQFVQTSLSSRPLYNNNRVRCSQARFLFNSSVQIFAGTTSGSVYLVGRNPTAYQGAWGRFSASTSTGFTVATTGTFSENFLSSSISNISSSLTYPVPLSLFNFDNSGTQLTVNVNGSLVGSATITYEIPLASSSNQRIGGNGGATSSFDLYEILVFARVLSSSEKQLIEGYLAWKWGLTSALAPGHLYKTNPILSLISITANDTVLRSLNAGQESDFVFTITRTGNLNKTTTVVYQAQGTSTPNISEAAILTDFVGASTGTVTFLPGETIKNILLKVNISTQTPVREFTVSLVNPENTSILIDKAIGRFRWNYQENSQSIINLNPVFWLDASIDNTVIRSGSSVSAWNTRTTNGFNFVNATTSTQPTYISSTEVTSRRIAFTSTRFLGIASPQLFSGFTTGSVFFVGRQPANNAGGWGRFSNSTSAPSTVTSGGVFAESFLASARVNVGSGVPYPLPNSIVTFENNNTQLTVGRNGTTVGSPVTITYTVPTASTTNQRLGGNSGDFEHQEVLMFRRVLTQPERELVEGHLAWKWGLVASLPASHPYKNTAPS